MTSTQIIMLSSVIGLGMLIWIGKYIVKIFSGKDGILNEQEFYRMVGCFTFLSLTIFMVVMEAFRENEYHLFSEFYIVIVIGGFLSIIGQEKFIDTIRDIFKAKFEKK